ncbi:MAG: type II toxin-antitoxin system Phd/YefM family antitoxin [Candidatus Scalindua sp. AMX11]|nr:MAG: type II toxin-antitoxin system Phd/YefM family antitoxin [Candidatus Scalindua sp.]NOG82635.1 type II toxin-antitoxin system Phd/YefM family antitoxin [Planctomycetota bacterium]RZV95211.1 MAG: type II toxin-antitoxin system Phd/YefM family antitoxin [Candidatus Scalindua sp. SCAELEC01]TDE66310.1 MAG: type II toxin-antitoxin system Phd/YefM family antitoxin [Candidatus Scalindua sp. AMX11]GJQ57935.1 MAG: hypothetical protein SCALA701_07360 [Candidatus Scalindua sp.]
MKASVVDLRYKTNEIMKALERNESVTVLYHGKIKGIIKPAREKVVLKVKEHPLFGMRRENDKTVFEELDDMRKPL